MSRYLLFLAGTALLRATTILAIWEPMAVTVGVDSRITRHTAQGDSYSDECKLWNSGSYYFTATGILNDGAGFNVHSLSLEAAKKGGSIADVAARFKVLAEAALPGVTSRINRLDPTLFTPEKPYLELIVFGFENGSAAISALSFHQEFDHPTRLESGAVDWNSPKDLPPGEDAGFFSMGDHTRMDRYMDALPDWSIGQPRETTIRQMIQLEVKDNPNVGGPISLLQVDSSGAHWFDTGVCHVP